jgi:2-hydroxychromene-2-carboxylate isomerase
VDIERQTAIEAAGDPTVKTALREATDAAHECGVFGVPTIAIGEELFWGDDRLLDAAARLQPRSDESSRGQPPLN